MPASPEEIVADEAPRRPKAAAAALLGALLTLVASVLRLSALSDQPRVQLVDALDERVGGHGPPVLKIQQALFFDDKAVSLIASAVLAAIGTAAVAYALTVLFRATRERRPDFGRVAIIAVMSGAVMVAVGGIASYVALASEASSFAGEAHRTAAGARDVIESPAYIAGQIISTLGSLALGLAFVLVSLNAMKAGLLTRFMGVLGVIGGALVVLPFLASGVPLVQVIWLVGVAVLLLGRWPGGMPPAWDSGLAVPWPSQQELREQRDAAKAPEPAEDDPRADARTAARKRGAPPPSPESEPLPEVAARAHSSSKKRKRKRRG